MGPNFVSKIQKKSKCCSLIFVTTLAAHLLISEEKALSSHDGIQIDIFFPLTISPYLVTTILRKLEKIVKHGKKSCRALQ